MPSGWDALLGRDEIEGFGVKALDDILQVTDYRLLPEGRMDGVIVTVVHDEFRGMGLSGVRGLLGAGAVLVDECGLCAGGYVVCSMGRGVGKGF